MHGGNKQAGWTTVYLAAFALMLNGCQGTAAPSMTSASSATAEIRPTASETPQATDTPSPASISTPTIATLPEVDGYIRAFDPDSHYINNLALSPSGTILATSWKTGVTDKEERSGTTLWDVATGTQLCTFNDSGSIAFSPSGQALLIGSDSRIRLWDVPTCSYSRTVYQIPYNGKGGVSWITDVAWSPNSTLAAVSWMGGGVQIWDLARDERLFSLGGESQSPHFGGIAFSHDGTRLVNLVYNVAAVWDPINGKNVTGYPIEASAPSKPNPRFARTADWSPDDSRLAVVLDINTIVLVNATNGDMVRELTGPDDVDAEDASWSPDGTMIAAVYSDDSVIVWNAGGGTQLRRLTVPATAEQNDYVLREVIWSRDGAQIISTTQKTAILWDAGQLLAGTQ